MNNENFKMKKMHRDKKYFEWTKALLFLPFTVFILHCSAQRDTTRRQTINITSSYKPVLRNAVKINLSASPLAADTSRPRLAYDIPAQNLFFAYQPITLKPLALTQDTTLQLGIRNYAKVGFGNLSTPYIEAAVSLGDGKKSLVNLYGNYISSKGKITNQNFNELELKGTGSYFTSKNEIYGSAGVTARQYYQYGYDHAVHNFAKDSISRKYQDFFVGAGLAPGFTFGFFRQFVRPTKAAKPWKTATLGKLLKTLF